MMRVEQGAAGRPVRVWRDSLGRRHRSDGPAVEGDKGFRAWWVHGEKVRVEADRVDEAFVREHAAMAMRLEQGFYGSVRAWRDSLGRYHRLEGPALEGDNGFRVWMVHGKIVRVDHVGRAGRASSLLGLGKEVNFGA